MLDEFGYVIEADSSVPSVSASASAPCSRRSSESRACSIVCGSAIAMMRALTTGTAAGEGGLGARHAGR